MRWTTPLLGAAIGAGIYIKRDPGKGALWGAGIGLLVTLLGGAAVSVGGINVRVGVDDDISGAQAMLNKLGFHVPTDGVAGPATTAALKQFQRNSGMRVVDGSVTPETLSALRNYTAPGPSGGASWST